MIDFKAMRGFDFNALPVFLCVFVTHFIDKSDAIGFISDPLNNTLDEAGSDKLLKLPYQSFKLDFYINYQAKR